MALTKEIELDNGIVVSYHRIVSINKITNKDEIIEVGSYINEQQREKEQTQPGSNVFIYTQYLNKEYDKDENINDVYSYLKTTDEFKDAEDA